MLIIMLGAIDLSISARSSRCLPASWSTTGPRGRTSARAGRCAVVSVLLSLVNGVLIAVLRLNAVIVTLATLGMILGAINLWTGVSLSVTGETPQRLQDLAQGSVRRSASCSSAAMIVCALMAAFLNKTRFGRQIAAVGSNRRAARVLGMQVRRVELATFALAGLLYGIAGLLLAATSARRTSCPGPYQMGTIVVARHRGRPLQRRPGQRRQRRRGRPVMQWLEQAMAILGLARRRPGRDPGRGPRPRRRRASPWLSRLRCGCLKRVVGSRGVVAAPTTS